MTVVFTNDSFTMINYSTHPKHNDVILFLQYLHNAPIDQINPMYRRKKKREKTSTRKK